MDTGRYDGAAAAGRGDSRVMANIASQKKRILRTERERLENRRYTSAIKTCFRRLQASSRGDDTAADAEHQQLIRLVDKAIKRGALHNNAGARKKSRAAKLRRGAFSWRSPFDDPRRSPSHGGSRRAVAFAPAPPRTPRATSTARTACVSSSSARLAAAAALELEVGDRRERARNASASRLPRRR